jgi:hypothetical protein
MGNHLSEDFVCKKWWPFNWHLYWLCQAISLPTPSLHLAEAAASQLAENWTVIMETG